uniref:8-oxo-dGTP diphosphatase n=1 Tax=Candidatus Kentrum eta TaxID=2126337 RepID=A0A450VDC3_9GAMM|nr:MAG: 8-oxo-dGTP diphosphatase [Candidatus Kentron sp. H]VFK02803.1 MAG: 8-oxo-dGTP diphosphatase [Candidatus Kentron sp. H]VFK05449.1 MAG: 8-oxo-dGTP diphosphatase [Candidatus Kentron sp. H]
MSHHSKQEDIAFYAPHYTAKQPGIRHPSPPSALPIAVAVLSNPQGEVLISRRRPDAHQGGLWEFPGGKVEPGEGVYAALCRELQEEIGITVESARPLIRVPHDYGERRVLLDVWRVTRWSGAPQGREGQAIAWVPPSLEALRAYPFPGANLPIITAAHLPETYLITPEPDWGDTDRFLGALETALARGIRLVQFRARPPDADGPGSGAYRRLAEAVLALCRDRGARCLLNGEPALARAMGMDGVHLTRRRLLSADAATLRRAVETPFHNRQGLTDAQAHGRRTSPRAAHFLMGASCHDRAELQRASRLGVHFAVLAPVKATKTHPGAEPLGWGRFAELTQESTLPVYALGGVSPGEMETAWRQGGQGIAAIRALWPETVGG